MRFMAVSHMGENYVKYSISSGRKRIRILGTGRKVQL